ncbi:hypothetical protein [Bradyrhizobium sp.]|uniref:hypothetical protein n=1 Tax=Bradyrhizobium sp. TaxID=376 RepID=UPI00273244BE|nr:hypothetical protein [Bradyrhizobium sp.]MDP3691480.1 hypothetical protein [Bradyrhizobium sp.]
MLFLFDGFLIQTGIKMLLIFVNLIYGKIDPAISLGVTFSPLAGGFLFSVWKTRSVLLTSPPAPTRRAQRHCANSSTSDMWHSDNEDPVRFPIDVICAETMESR